MITGELCSVVVIRRRIELYTGNSNIQLILWTHAGLMIMLLEGKSISITLISINNLSWGRKRTGIDIFTEDNLTVDQEKREFNALIR